MEEEVCWVYVYKVAVVDLVKSITRQVCGSRCSRLDHFRFTRNHGCNLTLPGDLSVRVVVGHVPGCSPLYYSSPVDGCPCACGPYQTAEAYSNVGHTTVVPGRSPT